MSRFRKRLIWIILGTVAILALLLGHALRKGLADPWLRRALLAQIEVRTGARAEMTGFRFQAWHLRVEIRGLTLHGRETSGAPPLFRASRVEAQVRIVSFFGRKIALNELVVDKPQLSVRIDSDGRSNIPTPRKAPASGAWRDTLFRLQVGHLTLRDGSVNFNDRRTPLSLNGRNIDFALAYSAPAGADGSYAGTLNIRQMFLALGRYAPFRSDLSARFTLYRNAFELDDFSWRLPHSNLQARATLASFSRLDWQFHYRGSLSLSDVATIFRRTDVPGGLVEFSGKAHYSAAGITAGKRGSDNPSPAQSWTASGYFHARDIVLPYDWFHAKDLTTWGDYEVASGRLTVPDLEIQALGGAATGNLALDFPDMAFRVETRMRGASLARIFAALDNPNFPVETLHWDAAVDVDAVNTWNANFRHFRTNGKMRWAPPGSPAKGMIPATARIDYDYTQDRRTFSISPSKITLPKARIRMDGALGAQNSDLDVKFHADDLLEWNDFINAIRGPHAAHEQIGGRADWSGRILGPLAGPAFRGHVDAASVSYGRLFWDQFAADMEYSPDGLHLAEATVRHGRAVASLTFQMDFDGAWSFRPENHWALDANIQDVPISDLQEAIQSGYPVQGQLTGKVHGDGTRASPVFDATLDARNLQVKSLYFDHMHAQLHAGNGEVRLADATLRRGTSDISGTLAYQLATGTMQFDVTGAGISLSSISMLESSTLPLAGQLDFHLRGHGPLQTSVAQGDFRIRNLRLGSEAEGDFRGRLVSDGQTARLTLTAVPTPDSLQGDVTIELTGDRRIVGSVSVRQFNLDPLITAGLHLHQLTGHGAADALFTISGNLRQPDSIEVQADIARISFNYELVQLANDQDIHLTYRRNEVSIEQARLRGPDTDFKISGSARFDGNRPLHFAVSGAVNLRLVKGLFPDLDGKGRADVNVGIGGNLSQPELTGRARVSGASISYADFPVGLTGLDGEFSFDKSRLVFDKITAQAGGGQLTLSGSLAYGEGPLRYQISAATSQVRIRYPAGISWLAGGTLELSGTKDAALLTGQVRVQRLLFAQGVDVASFFAAAAQSSPGPTSASPFLQNLAFDVEGRADPGARIEWTGAHVDMEGDVRLRGTWDRPVILGHIHLLGGEMPFRGNTFDLTRGDINFSNPFRLDPVLDVELASTINQYQVTVDFSGPASHLSMNYRSDPPLPDSEIVALLALGSPGEGNALLGQPGAAQNYGATALLSEAISSGIGGRIEHLFGINQFRIDPFLAGTATESNAAARVTIQKQVTRELTITYSTNAATSNQYQMVEVDYAVKNNLSVEFLRDINGTYGFDIKWIKHFK